MTENEFFHWLQGFFEISGPNAALSYQQVSVVKRRIDLVRESGNASWRLGQIAGMLRIADDPSFGLATVVSDQIRNIISEALKPEIPAIARNPIDALIG